MRALRRTTMLLAGVLALVLLAGCGLSDLFAAPSPSATASPSDAPSAEPTVTAIVDDLTDATIGSYGIRTKANLEVEAVGLNLTYAWQSRPGASGQWQPIAGATAAKYVARAKDWPTGTQFQVTVTGDLGVVASAIATLTVVTPTNTPARDAELAFGLTGLRQGVDLSGYQHTPDRKVQLGAVKAWAGKGGFVLLRNGSGDRPINYQYTDLCTGKSGQTKGTPATRDCGYPALAGAAKKAKLSLGHYWFNGWVKSVDTTKGRVFSGDATPTRSAKLFVGWLKKYGHYSKSSTDPLVLDIEDGTNRKLTKDGKKYHQKLRHWTPAESLEFLTAVRKQLKKDGYHANLYVYMSSKTALESDGLSYSWVDVSRVARLWIASWGTDNGRIPDSQPAIGPWADQGGWSIWQYTSQTRLPNSGVDAVDGNIARADAWKLRKAS